MPSPTRRPTRASRGPCADSPRRWPNVAWSSSSTRRASTTPAVPCAAFGSIPTPSSPRRRHGRSTSSAGTRSGRPGAPTRSSASARSPSRPNRTRRHDASVAREMLAAWDVIGDDTPVEVVIRFDPARLATRTRDPLAPQPGRGARGRWLTAVAGPRLGRARDPLLDPGLGSGRRGARTARTARMGRLRATPRPRPATRDSATAPDGRTARVLTALRHPSWLVYDCLRPTFRGTDRSVLGRLDAMGWMSSMLCVVAGDAIGHGR